MSRLIYLDNAATTQVYPEVVDAMLPYFTEHYGNPSAIYSFADEAERAVDHARGEVADLIGAKKDEIYFTGGGSESDNWALKATAEAYASKGKHIITTKIEHHAILHSAKALEKEGFEVRIAADGGKAVEEFKAREPDLVLLDVMLPVLDGWGVCAKIRETSKCPIIMLTAKGEVNDRIHGLEMGADDYLVKPFEMKELIARINAVLRRTEIPEDTKKRLVFDKLIIDLDSYELIVDGKKIDTPPKELELLYHLAATPNRVYTRNQLLDEVWGFDYFGDSRTVDVHIKRLREKVENVSDQWELKTVWGVGYKFEVKK